MPAFENFDRLAMSEAQFLRMAEAEYQASRPIHQNATPTFVQRFLFKSPSLGTSSIRGSGAASASASPTLSSPSSSPRQTMDGFGSSPHINSPNMSSGWGLGLVFRKRSNTNSSFGSNSPRMGGSPRMDGVTTRIGGTSPSLGAGSPRMGGAAYNTHKRGGSGDSHDGKQDEFGLAKNKWTPELR